MNDAAWQQQERESPARWAVCLLVVAAAHVGAGVFLVTRTPHTPTDITTPVLMIDMAPAPSPPPEPAPEPEQVAEPPPPVPVDVPPPEPPPPMVLEPPPPPPPPIELPPPELPPELLMEPPPVPVTPAVPLPPKPPPPKRPPPVRPVSPRPVAAEPTPPPAAPPPAAAAPAATAVSPAAAATWESRLLAHLKRAMRYPTQAQMRRQQGVALLWFRMTPSGEVLAARIERSSGHEVLDEESLALIRRAQPLPALPPDMPQQTIERVIPLRYELK
ncbi:MAG: energy transducer TonB [Acetobacteraceae bacterium]